MVKILFWDCLTGFHNPDVILLKISMANKNYCLPE